ncbi:MAG: gamma-glutamylcyclotransferase [Nitrososphaera sp.]|nr:gamma-glutamylcyclotransferase [Nitrososphaera sp.]
MMTNPQKNNLLFVYGLLKRFEGGQEGEVSGFRLVDLGYFPAAIPAEPQNVVKGKLIAVSDQKIKEFDRIEGAPGFYHRRVVNVDVGFEIVKAQIYVIGESWWNIESESTPNLSIDEKLEAVYYDYHIE